MIKKSKNLKAKKSLGQHWLTSIKAVEKIITVAEIKPKDKILEIGPGRGILTAQLLEARALVWAIEKDRRLIADLQEKFTSAIKNNQLHLIEADIIDIDINKLTPKYKLVANIPYYLTGQIFRKFLSAKNKPALITLLIQKEVAQRIIAKNDKESLLSLSVKAYGQPKIEAIVKAGSFSPSPKVDSAILSIKNISNDFFKNLDEQKFFEVIRICFGQKRKQIKSVLKIESQKLKTIGLADTIRPEDLKLTDWPKLISIIND